MARDQSTAEILIWRRGEHEPQMRWVFEDTVANYTEFEAWLSRPLPLVPGVSSGGRARKQVDYVALNATFALEQEKEPKEDLAEGDPDEFGMAAMLEGTKAGADARANEDSDSGK